MSDATTTWTGGPYRYQSEEISEFGVPKRIEHHLYTEAPMRDGRWVAMVKDEATARRIQQCETACRGIEDPAAAIEGARAAMRGAILRLESYYDYLCGEERPASALCNADIENLRTALAALGTTEGGA